MTQEELKKYKKDTPPVLDFIRIKDEVIQDKYGVYSTGYFEYKGKSVVVARENGVLHLSVSANHPLGYYELKQIRYMFLPNAIQVAQIFPPREEFVNVHENCFHLWEIKAE